MALIKVRATNLGFNGGPNAKAKSIWAFNGDRKQVIADEDRGLKNIGDVFMVEESKFTDSWMERVDPLPVRTEITQASPAVVTTAEAPKRGRPKKIG